MSLTRMGGNEPNNIHQNYVLNCESFDPRERVIKYRNTIVVIPKPLGFVAGERVLRPLIDTIYGLSSRTFSYLKSGFLYLDDLFAKTLSLLPIASASAVLKEANEYYTYKDTCRVGDHDASCEKAPERQVCWRNSEANPYNTLDLMHARMLALGIFTPAEVNSMVMRAIALLRSEYGIDFSQANVNVIVGPEGVRTIQGIATMLPYFSPSNVIIGDINHEERVGKWHQISAGVLVIFGNTEGINDLTPQNSGEQHKPKSLWYGYNLYFKIGADPSKEENREIVPLTRYQLGLKKPHKCDGKEISITCVNNKCEDAAFILKLETP